MSRRAKRDIGREYAEAGEKYLFAKTPFVPDFPTSFLTPESVGASLWSDVFGSYGLALDDGTLVPLSSYYSPVPAHDDPAGWLLWNRLSGRSLNMRKSSWTAYTDSSDSVFARLEAVSSAWEHKLKDLESIEVETATLANGAPPQAAIREMISGLGDELDIWSDIAASLSCT